jgi:ribosomal protein L40E
MDIVGMLLQTIQSIAILLVLFGMLIAFLWKIAAIINFVFGFILTILLTYVIYTITNSLIPTAAMFIGGLMVTFVIAALAGLLCIFEGFVLSALGFWALFASGSPLNSFSTTNLIGSVIASVFSTGIAAYFGGRILSPGTPKIGKRSKNNYQKTTPSTTYTYDNQTPNSTGYNSTPQPSNNSQENASTSNYTTPYTTDTPVNNAIETPPYSQSPIYPSPEVMQKVQTLGTQPLRTRFCGYCGIENSVAAKFCRKCGKNTNQSYDAAQKVQPVETLPLKIHFCGYCGTQNSFVAKFCRTCGVKIKKQDS